jgi:GntR family transcriptional regulator, trigonelline degradation regulator
VAGESLRVQRSAAPVRSQVLENLRTAIKEQRFPPGHRLVERELCEMTGVSRTSVREALRQLESEGLVEVVPNYGPIVAEITARDARQLYEVRGALEGLAGRLFTAASDEHIKQLREVVEEIGAAGAAGRVDELLQLDERFYEILLDGADNQVVTQVLTGLHARISCLRTATLRQEARSGQTYKELRAIVESVEAHDPDAVERACREHVASAARIAFQCFDEEPADREELALAGL